MSPKASYPILAALVKPLRRSQQKTLVAVVSALLRTGIMRTLALAACLSVQSGIRLDSAHNRIYRLLRNDRIDDWDLTTQMLALCRGVRGRLLIAVDWTEWHSQMRSLCAAVICERRAVPVACAAFDQLPPRSQNARENTFLQLLADSLRRAGFARALLLFDRGFRRVSFVRELLRHGQDFIVRLQADVNVHLADGTQRKLSRLDVPPGRVLDLGRVPLRSDQPVTVRVLGVRGRGTNEVWWRATNLRARPAKIAVLYDKRMDIEELFRDVKGARYGLKLEWTRFRKPEVLQRAAMLAGLATLVWLAVGAWAARTEPSRRMVCRYKGPRVSLFQLGIAWLRQLPARMRLGGAFVRRWLPPPIRNEFDPFHPLPLPA
jgi:hypothetical protein